MTKTHFFVITFKKNYEIINYYENVSTNYKQCFVQTVLQNVLIKYVIVQVQLNIV